MIPRNSGLIDLPLPYYSIFAFDCNCWLLKVSVVGNWTFGNQK